ncbi:adenine nucleotide alpha hydrolases-like superfamily protein [Actinidia rufa]|uniref:Adenine nucleotide alpha hydrolases-like superfamily protein n=1 Tax=Actinidia rufa TaxID=165716 RepID=A0A7J0F5J9_9ERIC|nr:adenine nucleotide alpha hydrolases-like superfamily protein [Actinidia rufa]
MKNTRWWRCLGLAWLPSEREIQWKPKLLKRGRGVHGPAPPTVAEGEKSMRLMVAVDDSDESFYALKWALDNLFPTAVSGGGEGAESVGMVTVLHVMQPFQPLILPAGPGAAAFATPSMVESVRKAQEENAANILSRALHMCKHKMIKAETLILQGEGHDLSSCRAMQVDFVVVGSRGLGKIKGVQLLTLLNFPMAFLGSVSDYCAHHVKCPILIVKPPKQSH